MWDDILFFFLFVRPNEMVWCKNHPAPIDGAGPRAWPPSYRAIMSLREARWSCRAWKTNSPQDPSDNIIYIIAWKHLHKKQWLPAASLTCHSYERLGFDVQWVKEIILGHADVVTPRHVWTTKRGPLIWLQRGLLLYKESFQPRVVILCVCFLLFFLATAIVFLWRRQQVVTRPMC